MRDRIIGILGGMGPEATADLLLEITHLTPATKDQDHIRVLIYSNPKIPDRTRAIVGEGEDPLPTLIETARVLESGGAGVLAIPCNAAHHYVPMIQCSIGIPVLHMIEETCSELKATRPPASSVGLLATTGTIRSSVYRSACARAGLRLLAPEQSEQDRLDAAVLDVKGGVNRFAAGETFESIGEQLIGRGAEAVILGCTEIPLVFRADKVRYRIVNPTRVLARAAVDWALRRRE